MFAMWRSPPFSEADLRVAVAGAECWSDALRLLGYQPKGHNNRTLKRYVAQWCISTAHFDPHAGRRRAAATQTIPLNDVLVKNSTYPRGRLKRRLLAAELIPPWCELCGQGEIWHGKRMSLVLDHINGVSNDNRLVNLQIVCPNCAATFDTHCGRKNRVPATQLACLRCGTEFWPQRSGQRYCSRECGTRYKRSRDPRPELRKVERPSYEQLMKDVTAMSFCAVGRKYGVSDNAVRKWIRWYERGKTDRGEAEGE